MSTETKELKIPFTLSILASGVTGATYEILPRLARETKSQDELDAFGIHMMDTIGDRYKIPTCGSVMWVIYKEYCKKDLEKFMKCVDTTNKQVVIREWLLDNYPG